jgi:hypothetical protein
VSGSVSTAGQIFLVEGEIAKIEKGSEESTGKFLNTGLDLGFGSTMSSDPKPLAASAVEVSLRAIGKVESAADEEAAVVG